MKQRFRIIIRWQDEDGCVMGAIRENDIEFPKWGKRQILRNEINRHIVWLCFEQHKIGSPERFYDYAMKSFKPSQIITIRARTKGSYLSFTGDNLQKFLEDNNLK